MTSQAIREKASARRVLVILIGLLVTVMALQGIASVRSGGFEAFAQATGAPTIKLLNPDSTTSRVASDKQDADAAYHLVAAISSIPSNPTVRFEVLSGDTRVVVIDATRVGATDTWESFWQIPDTVADGAYTLEAHLFSNGTFVNEDSEAITVNQTGTDSPDPRNDTAETLEIMYPTNAGSLGYRGTATAKTFVMRVITSSDAPYVRGFYSVAPPGTEPAYTACGDFQALEDDVENTNGTHSGAISCSLASADAGKPVTAVAAVTNDTPLIPDPSGAQAQFTDSGDGHRVTEFYLQDPTTVTVEGSTTGATGTCVRKVATVLD